MEARTNCFERLSDDLVGQIFEKLLWNPNVFGVPKALQRLRLEAVCRRFQDLVHNAGCLDWEFRRSEDELAFLRYTLRERTCASLLTKVALAVEHPVNLAAILQSIILQAQDSLEEVQLVMGGAGAASIMDFEYMLPMFQACKELATLEVLYWMREPQLSQRLLCNDWLPKPFARLRTLTLQGFAVSPLRFDAFIKCFPLLTSLELNHLTGAAYALRSSSLGKVFWWGNEAAGIDIENPSRVGVPRSLEKGIALLDSRSIEIKEKAVKMLLGLASIAGSRLAVARAPGCLQRLGALLQAPSTDLQNSLPGLLWELAANDVACKVIVQTPDIVLRLAELLTGAPLEAVNGDVLGALQSLAAESEARTVIASVPGCLQRIVNLLVREPTRELAACVLEKVVCDYSLERAIVDLPGLMETLVEFLDAGISDEALEPVVGALKGLAWRCRARIVALPGCLPKLLSLLRGASSYVHQAVGDILWNLGDCGDKVWEVPGFLEELVSLLSCGSASAQASSVKILEGFAADAAKRKVIASAPGCLKMLCALLGTSEHRASAISEVLTTWIMDLLWRLMEEADVRKTLMETPGVLQRLVDILAPDQEEGLLLSTTSVLQKLTADPANRKTIAAVPGCLERLVSVMEVSWAPQTQASVLADLAEDMAVGKAIAAVPGALAGLLENLNVEIHEDAYAARALKTLAADSETARAIAAVPGSIQKLKGFCEIEWGPYVQNRGELGELGPQILHLLGVEFREAGAMEGCGGELENFGGGLEAEADGDADAEQEP